MAASMEKGHNYIRPFTTVSYGDFVYNFSPCLRGPLFKFTLTSHCQETFILAIEAIVIIRMLYLCSSMSTN